MLCVKCNGQLRHRKVVIRHQGWLQNLSYEQSADDQETMESDIDLSGQAELLQNQMSSSLSCDLSGTSSLTFDLSSAPFTPSSSGDVTMNENTTFENDDHIGDHSDNYGNQDNNDSHHSEAEGVSSEVDLPTTLLYLEQSLNEQILRILKSKSERGWSREEALEQLLSFYNFNDSIPYKEMEGSLKIF